MNSWRPVGPVMKPSLSYTVILPSAPTAPSTVVVCPNSAPVSGLNQPMRTMSPGSTRPDQLLMSELFVPR